MLYLYDGSTSDNVVACPQTSFGRMDSRTIAKQDSKAVADAGGVVGVWTKGTNSPKDHVEGIKMVVEAIGINHVGIGTDDDLLSPRTGTGLKSGLAGNEPRFLPRVRSGQRRSLEDQTFNAPSRPLAVSTGRW